MVFITHSTFSGVGSTPPENTIKHYNNIYHVDYENIDENNSNIMLLEYYVMRILMRIIRILCY